jgi:hypothetical protein
VAGLSGHLFDKGMVKIGACGIAIKSTQEKFHFQSYAREDLQMEMTEIRDTGGLSIQGCSAIKMHFAPSECP